MDRAGCERCLLFRHYNLRRAAMVVIEAMKSVAVLAAPRAARPKADGHFRICQRSAAKGSRWLIRAGSRSRTTSQGGATPGLLRCQTIRYSRDKIPCSAFEKFPGGGAGVTTRLNRSPRPGRIGSLLPRRACRKPCVRWETGHSRGSTRSRSRASAKGGRTANSQSRRRSGGPNAGTGLSGAGRPCGLGTQRPEITGLLPDRTFGSWRQDRAIVDMGGRRVRPLRPGESSGLVRPPQGRLAFPILTGLGWLAGQVGKTGQMIGTGWACTVFKSASITALAESHHPKPPTESSYEKTLSPKPRRDDGSCRVTGKRRVHHSLGGGPNRIGPG